MSVAAEEFIGTGSDVAVSLDQRRATFRRRRLAISMRDWVSLAATGAIGAWVCAVITISVQAH